MLRNSEQTPFPATGKPGDAVLREIDQARANDWDWFSLKNLTASYYGGPDVAELAKEAFLRHIGDNVIHQTGLHPSVRKYETEVIDMVKDLFNAPEGATGTITTGGSESILMALKTARDRARELSGITEHQIVVPQSGYAVFNKLCHYLGIEVVQMDRSPGYRADVAGMRDAITGNTIMLVGSAPPFPLANVDPIAEIAALTEAHGIWMQSMPASAASCCPSRARSARRCRSSTSRSPASRRSRPICTNTAIATAAARSSADGNGGEKVVHGSGGMIPLRAAQ